MGSKHVVRSDLKAQILKRLKEEGVTVAKGISSRTIYGWLSEGVVKEQPYNLPRFSLGNM